MALPTFVNATAKATGAGADVTPAAPTHQAGDILLVFAESANETITLASAQGFAEVPDSPQGTGTEGATTGTRLAIFWKRAASGAETMPTVEGSALNHLICCVASFRGCIAAGDPWDVTAGDTEDTSVEPIAVPGDTTTVADCLIVAASSCFTDNNTGQFSGWANADLANVTDRVNIGTNAGNGGGIGMATGEKATAGTFGATTATLNTGNPARQARIMIALKPPLTFTGTGATAAGGVATAGTGAQTFTGTAATAAGGAATDGSGTVTGGSVTGTGATAVGGAATDGTGTYTPLAITGTAACAVGGAATASSGTLVFTGTAAAAAGGIATDASGAQTFTGTAALAAGGIATDATGAQTFTGTGATAVGGAATDASGTYTALAITGTGATTAGGVATDGDGAYTPLAITGTGATAAGGAATDGDGELQGVFGGTADCAVGGAETAGAGTYTPQAITGTAACAAGGVATDATGAQTFTGTGSTAAGGAATDGDGTLEFTGTAALAVAGVATDGDGNLDVGELTGTGACAVAGCVASGTGTIVANRNLSRHSADVGVGGWIAIRGRRGTGLSRE